MEESPSRSLRSATSPPSVQITSKSTPGSELTLKTKESVVTPRVSVAAKRKTKDSEKDDTTDEDDDDADESSSGKRQRVEKPDVDQTEIEFNREEKQYVTIKVRSGDSITSPCWSSKLCQVVTLSKEGLAMMKKAKSKSIF